MSHEANEMKDLLVLIASSLVNEPDAVRVEPQDRGTRFFWNCTWHRTIWARSSEGRAGARRPSGRS